MAHKTYCRRRTVVNKMCYVVLCVYSTTLSGRFIHALLSLMLVHTITAINVIYSVTMTDSGSVTQTSYSY